MLLILSVFSIFWFISWISHFVSHDIQRNAAIKTLDRWLLELKLEMAV